MSFINFVTNLSPPTHITMYNFLFTNFMAVLLDNIMAKYNAMKTYDYNKQFVVCNSTYMHIISLTSYFRQYLLHVDQHSKKNTLLLHLIIFKSTIFYAVRTRVCTLNYFIVSSACNKSFTLTILSFALCMLIVHMNYT